MHFHEFYARARFQSARRINLSSDSSSQTQKTYISMYNFTYKRFLQVLLIIMPLFATHESTFIAYIEQGRSLLHLPCLRV